jgi:glycosyltransferase involved in cell wall biosynthesis
MACSPGLVSIVIPCYELGHFLAEAVNSVLEQTYPEHEIVIVDDGSTDNTSEVAARFPQARYLRQSNRGTASARNLGIREAKGDYLVFLDADDRLLPRALEIGVNALAARRDCAMTFGTCMRIDEAGTWLPSFWRPLVSDDYYRTFLRRCYIYHPASIMCRRDIFAAGIRFDESLTVCSDYDFYLKVARRWPIHCHNERVSEYRQHSQQKSSNSKRMLEATLRVLRSQEPFARETQAYRKALRKGKRISRQNYSRELIEKVWANLRSGDAKIARRDLIEFLKYDPLIAGWILPRAIVKTCLSRLKPTRKSQTPALQKHRP